MSFVTSPSCQEIDIDVLVGLQRCRGPTVDKAIYAICFRRGMVDGFIMLFYLCVYFPYMNKIIKC